LQPVVLENCHKKILREILCVLNRIAACPHKQENGPPINPAKFRQRIARLLLFTPQIGRRKDQTPAGSYKLTRYTRTLVAVLPVHK